METIKAILVDDEPKLQRVLEVKLKRYCPGVEVVATARDVTEAMSVIARHQPDLVFLDIAMPGGSGFDLLRRLPRINFEVIFVTGFNDYALDALKISAVDYLLKPVNTEDLISAVEKALTRVSDRQKIQRYDNLQHNLRHLNDQETKVAIPGAKAYDFVPVKSIIRCEGWQKYTKIYLTDGTCLISSYNIGVFVNLLKSYGFYGVHKSHFINIQMIRQYQNDGMVIMRDGSEVPVARRKREAFVKEVVKTHLA
ncbi:MAG: LytTR family DNA-binding domain-containing protein [Bacteroidota bacterium]